MGQSTSAQPEETVVVLACPGSLFSSPLLKRARSQLGRWEPLHQGGGSSPEL